MRTKILISLLAVIFLTAGCLLYMPEGDYSGGGPTTYDQTGPSGPVRGPLDQSYFYDYLSPYGNWLDYPSYGYVWVPRTVGYGWRPYTVGRWAYTNDGWTWVSAENWGWAVYHYGRWGWDRRIGWFWVPDRVWAPAWVVWRWDDIYFGWAPLPPGYDLRPGRGFGRDRFDLPNDHWIFVSGRHFMDHGMDRWVLPRERNMTIISLTSFKANMRYDNGRVINDGPPSDHVRRQTGKPINRYSLKDSGRPGTPSISGGEVRIYKPDLAENRTARPKTVIRENELEQGDGARKIGTVRPVDINRVQNREKELLKESHDLELRDVTRSLEAEKSRARTEEERKLVSEKLNSRVNELRKAHEREKAEMTKRQKEESGRKVIRKEEKKEEKKETRKPAPGTAGSGIRKTT